MKIKNYIMSKILSPGAYAVWHSLGNPEEWGDPSRHTLPHQSGAVNLDVSYGASRFYQFLCGGFEFDDIERPFLGWFERHLVYPRALRMLRRRDKLARMSERKKRNLAVFIKLTVNE